MGLLWYSLFLLSLCFSLSTSSYTDLFDSWCNQHNKVYSSEEEKLYRFRVFEENLAFINQHNEKGDSTYSLALNAFADLTHHEFRSSRLGFGVPGGNSMIGLMNRTGFVGSIDGEKAPESVDWRKKGAVTPVKDQSSCGDCWAFSATGAMEGINKIVTGSLVSLSEQELCDCDKSYNNGCNGGLMDYAYKWVIKNRGIDTEEDYPYKSRDGICLKNKLTQRVVTIDGYTDVPSSNEKQLLQAVAAQPVSVGICGSERAFQLYSKGIFTGPCSTALDHAVLIVGYDSENGVDFWIVKNSWGKSWGMDGYMHLQRNSGDPEGICGINMLASYPTKTSPNPPPSPRPQPTKCSLMVSCPAESTCCCSLRFFGLCLSWGCCGLDSAVCCKDGRSCCPSDYPVCDIKRQQCFKGTGNSTRVKGMTRKAATTKFGGWNSLFEDLGL
ncbi:Oryzain beta chain [Acorus gramineus]|uniref:Oryzain beta chain n=1 Tax=Acorus gramineus TaxID=55184 RepID=A0AAV9B6K3_ACOGR|nr:Oryzain beta chain [Acorus gramineus]